MISLARSACESFRLRRVSGRQNLAILEDAGHDTMVPEIKALYSKNFHCRILKRNFGKTGISCKMIESQNPLSRKEPLRVI